MKDTETADKERLKAGRTPRERADRERAEAFADLVYRPRGTVRPDREQVFRFLAGQMGTDPGELLRWERERFVCRNGPVEIHGEFYPLKNAAACAVLAHGFGQNRYILLPQQKILRELGFSTVIFDQRGFGESTETYCTFGIREAQDVACVADWAKARCPGDTRLLTGEAVQLRSGGAAGLFWVDSDTHTWKNSLYRTKVTLNFRNLMSSTMAGSDLK